MVWGCVICVVEIYCLYIYKKKKERIKAMENSGDENGDLPIILALVKPSFALKFITWYWLMGQRLLFPYFHVFWLSRSLPFPLLFLSFFPFLGSFFTCTKPNHQDPINIWASPLPAACSLMFLHLLLLNRAATVAAERDARSSSRAVDRRK